MSKIVRVGLIGYGFAGRTFHAPVITTVPQLQLVKVVERHGEASRQRYPWVEVVRDTAALYQDDTIELVVVATPSTNHYEVVREALLANKHVVVEKPFTVTSGEADELISIARERGLVLSVYHNRRWDGDFLTVRRLLERSLIGKPALAEFRWDRYAPVVNPARWREAGAPGSGTFYDLGIHLIDQALCLFGSPQEIRADVRIQREGALSDDYFDISLFYADGLKVTIGSTYLAREQGPRYVLHGSSGSFVKHGIDPQEAALKAGLTPASPNWGTEPKELWGTLNTTVEGLHFVGQIETIAGSYASYYRNVYEAITGQGELAVKPEQARNAVRIVELALQSSAERRAAEVRLPQ